MDPAGESRRPNPPLHTLKGGREGTNEQGPRHVSLLVGSSVGGPVLALKRRDGRGETGGGQRAELPRLAAAR